MNIVAITACPTGIAHTYMAAEKLVRTAEKLGHNIKVETQGATGIENELTAQEIVAADVVILANDIAIEGEERLSGKKKISVRIHDVLKNPESVFDNLTS